MSRRYDDDESAGGSRHQLLSRRDSHNYQQRSVNYQNGMDFPHNAINSHRQIQRHIDYERAQPVRVPSERTSIYIKGSDGLMEKTDRYGNRVGIKRQVVPGIDQHHLFELQKKNNLSFDSDDAAKAELGGPVLPKKRAKPPCCSGLKQIDMYGITPTMMIEGKSKFKSWWGAFFSLLVIVSVLSYVGLKVLFTLYNQTSNIQARHLFNDFGSELGQTVMSLNEAQVSVDFEFRHNPTAYAINKTTPITSKDTYKQDLLSFFDFIIVEVETIERDLETGTDKVETERLPFEVRIKDVASEYGTPTMRVDASKLKVRGDPEMEPDLFKRGHSYGKASEEKFQKGLVKELADWVHLDGPFPDLKPYADAVWKNVTALVTRQSAAETQESEPESSEAESTEDPPPPANPGRRLQSDGEDSPPPNGEAQDPDQKEEKKEVFNPISTQIRFIPDYQQLEDLASAAFEKQPGVYLEKQTAFDLPVYREYSRLVAEWEEENAQQYLGGDLELWQFRKRYYEQFLANCSNYMVSLVVSDKFLAQDGDNEVVLVDRHDRVFTKPFYPDYGARDKSHVRFQVHTYERDNHFHWPSAHWLFKQNEPESEISNADRFMARDHEYVDRFWPKSDASYPYDKVSTPDYTKLTVDADLFTSQRVDVSVTTGSESAAAATIWNATQSSGEKYSINAFKSETETVKYQELGSTLLEVKFYQNPVSVWYQKQDFKHWIVDQLADIGGFIVFCFLVFGVPCVAMQWRLYEAQIVQDRYRLKFNKILKGVKDQSYKKRDKKDENESLEEGEDDQEKENILDDIDQQDEKEDSDDDPQKLEERQYLRKLAREEMAKLEEKINVSYDVEGGSAEANQSTDNRKHSQTINKVELSPDDLCDFEDLTDEERCSRRADQVELEIRNSFSNDNDVYHPQLQKDGSDKSDTIRIEIFEGGNQGDGTDGNKEDPGTTRPLLAKLRTSLATLATPRAAQAPTPEQTEAPEGGANATESRGQTEGSESAQKKEVFSRLQGSIKAMFSQKKNDAVIVTDKPEETKEQDLESASKKGSQRSNKSNKNGEKEDATSDKQSKKSGSARGSKSSKKEKQQSAEGSQKSKRSQRSNKNGDGDQGETKKDVVATTTVSPTEQQEDTKQKIMNAFSSHFGSIMRRTTPVPVPQPQPPAEQQQEEVRSQSQKSTPAAAIAIKQVDEEEEKQRESKGPEEAPRQSTKGGKVDSAADQAPLADTKRASEKETGPELREDIGDDALPDLVLDDPQDEDADFQPQDKPKYKLFEPLSVSTFQIVRLAITPSCLYTYYQMALDRMFKKAIAKYRRDIEISTLLKRVCDANNLSQSMGEFEVFKDLKKQYKNSYSNVVNVSLDTELSIVEEHQKPIQPADPPYQRRKLKKYVEGPDGILQGVMELQPYELDPAALTMIARTVWRKLRQDAALTQQMAEQVRLEARFQEEAWGRDFAAAQLRQVPQSENAFGRSSARRDEDHAGGLEEAVTPRPPHSEAGGRKKKEKNKDKSRPESKRDSKSSSKPTKPAEAEGGKESGDSRGRTKTKSEHKSIKLKKEENRSEPPRSEQKTRREPCSDQKSRRDVRDVSNPRTEKKQPEVSEKRRASTKPRDSQQTTKTDRDSVKLDYSVFSKEKPPPNLDSEKAKQLMARYLRKQLRKQSKPGKR